MRFLRNSVILFGRFLCAKCLCCIAHREKTDEEYTQYVFSNHNRILPVFSLDSNFLTESGEIKILIQLTNLI